MKGIRFLLLQGLRPNKYIYLPLKGLLNFPYKTTLKTVWWPLCVYVFIYVSSLVLLQFSLNIKSNLTLPKFCLSQHTWKIECCHLQMLKGSSYVVLCLSKLNIWHFLSLSLQRRLPGRIFVMLSALQFICGFHKVLCQKWTQLKHRLRQSKAKGVHDGVTGILHRWLALELCFPKEIRVYVSS